MSKTIRLEDGVYDRLDKLLKRGETFSHGVNMLLDVYESVDMLTSVIDGQKRFEEFKAERLKE